MRKIIFPTSIEGVESFDIVIGDNDEMIAGELFFSTKPAHECMCRSEKSVLDRLFLGTLEELKEEDMIVSVWSGITWNLLDNGNDLLANASKGIGRILRPIRENGKIVGVRKVEPDWCEFERAAIWTSHRRLIFVKDSELDDLLDRDRPLPVKHLKSFR